MSKPNYRTYPTATRICLTLILTQIVSRNPRVSKISYYIPVNTTHAKSQQRNTYDEDFSEELDTDRDINVDAKDYTGRGPSQRLDAVDSNNDSSCDFSSLLLDDIDGDRSRSIRL